jgi:hypothetical protein
MGRQVSFNPQLASITVSRDRQPLEFTIMKCGRLSRSRLRPSPRWTWRIASMLLSRRTVTINSKTGYVARSGVSSGNRSALRHERGNDERLGP